MTQHYEAIGSVRGPCGHRHKCIRTAQDCVEYDQRGCASQGGYSDRHVHLIEDGVDQGCVEEDVDAYVDEGPVKVRNARGEVI